VATQRDDEPSDPVLAEIRAKITSRTRDLEELHELEREQLGAGGAVSWLELGSVLEARHNVGQRFSTGLPSLDAKLEGGLYAGTLTIVQGKPGIGKTMLATQIALHMTDKCAVAVLYADEGMQGAAVRIGQQMGVPRESLMNGEGVNLARTAIEKAPFFRFLDPSRPESTVEFMFEEFHKMAPQGLQRVYLVDSAQVVRSSKVTPRQDRRQAISTLLVELRELALRYRAIVLVVSQVGRGSYRSKNEDERVDPLAAGLETSAIEFMADLILHLDGKPTKEDPNVKLRCPKNRLSAEGSFELPLVMDFARARLLEADIAQIEADQAIVRDNELRKIAEEIRALLIEDHPDGASTRTIMSESGKRWGDVGPALKAGTGCGLLAKIKRTGRGGGVLYMAKT
jgi:RecA/RadA recombinase